MLKIILLVVASFLILLSLLQSGKSDGISGAFSGQQGMGLFANVKERGPEKTISNITMFTGIVFFLLVIIIRVVEKV